MVRTSLKCYMPCFISIGTLILENIFEWFLPCMGVTANLFIWPRSPNKLLSPVSRKLCMEFGFSRPSVCVRSVFFFIIQRRWLKMLTDDRRTADALLYNYLIYEPKGSCELKYYFERFTSYTFYKLKFCWFKVQSGSSRQQYVLKVRVVKTSLTIKQTLLINWYCLYQRLLTHLTEITADHFTYVSWSAALGVPQDRVLLNICRVIVQWAIWNPILSHLWYFYGKNNIGFIYIILLKIW